MSLCCCDFYPNITDLRGMFLKIILKVQYFHRYGSLLVIRDKFYFSSSLSVEKLKIIHFLFLS